MVPRGSSGLGIALWNIRPVLVRDGRTVSGGWLRRMTVLGELELILQCLLAVAREDPNGVGWLEGSRAGGTCGT